MTCTDRDLRYQNFLESKQNKTVAYGFQLPEIRINPALFPFQRALTKWAIAKGRCAIFADTGLGKTYMQLEWVINICQHTNGKALIVAPLSVTRQTVKEGEKLGIRVDPVIKPGPHSVEITNYERLDAFDPSLYKAVVLDESSILKSLDGKTRQRLIDMFGDTPYRLCCTATPAPNDIAEIANHAEFLGIMSRANMLAMFFVHDDKGWRLKGHAEQAFYAWLSSWGMSVRLPSDIGFADNGYILPPLSITPEIVPVDFCPQGQLLNLGLSGISGRLEARRATMGPRLERVTEMVKASPDQWILWCGLNDEAATLTKMIPGAVNVQGSDSIESKVANIEAFQDGKLRVMVTKSKIAGYGMNFQGCHRMAFVGLSDSWEAYYQCIRRCYRFGQSHPVDVRIVVSDAEMEVYENVMRKEHEAKRMSDELIKHVASYEQAEIGNRFAATDYLTDTIKGEGYRLMLGDSSERLAEVANDSVDLSIFSPPFMSLYTYSPTERDLGNSRDEQEFFGHFGYIINHLLRVTKPGRNCCVHVAQVPAMLVRDGYIGLKDFRGKTINAFEEHGWIYHGEVCIDKDPQAQAIRTHSKGLLFVQMKKDASWLRPALADYILVFRKPGENAMPVIPDLTNNEWIEFARPIWYGIKESNTLNVAEARGDKDERHIAALQLETIKRCIRLWSNKGETILSPFAGIGSEGYMALKLGRKYIGIELNPQYFETAKVNLERAITHMAQAVLL